ncbi:MULTISPECIES: hypothetical protein [Streptomyces]|nr:MULTISPECIES: hypothetical protein [Streptomyces]
MTRIRKFALGLALVTALWGATTGLAHADHHISGGTQSSGR